MPNSRKQVRRVSRIGLGLVSLALCQLCVPASYASLPPVRILVGTPGSAEVRSIQSSRPGGPGVRSLHQIDSRADFDRLARVHHQGRFSAVEAVMFVIDRRTGSKVYYVNSKVFKFHKDFINATYLSLERGQAFYENNYLRSDRRFILGTLAYQPAVEKFSFEFWEGDRLNGALLLECYEALSRTFFSPLFFKPTSTAHEQVAEELNLAGRLPALTNDELARGRSYHPLNTGTGIGQLRIVERLTKDTVIDRNQVVIFKEAPLRLTPLSGIITTEAASPLSHANILAKSWGIPNAHIRNADQLFKELEGKYVRYEVREDGFKLEPADPREVSERNKLWVRRADLVTPPADLSEGRITDLRHQRARDAIRFGAKSANLGEIINSRLQGMEVPRGFTVPFRYYAEFISLNQLDQRIADAVEEDRFVHDPAYRKSKLSEIRGWIQKGRHDPRFKTMIVEKTKREYRAKGLFIRSSTNAEDLPNFSGAGLYTTVPNVRGERQLLEGIKTVWASIWNYEAYEAREAFGMNHFGVYPAVLIQEGIDADSAGVAITTDPFDRSNLEGIFINAKRGLGIKVVEGRRVPEQVIYSPATGSILVLTRSDEDTKLTFDDLGGIKEVRIDHDRRVLTDAMVRKLGEAALSIKRVFGGRDQDIEWLFRSDRLYIVQSRPYVE